MHESEKWNWSRSVMSNPQWPHGLQPSRLLCPWDFPGKSTAVGCHCLLHRFSAFSIKLPMAFFTELEQNFYSVYGNRRPQIAKAILRKKSKSWQNQVPQPQPTLQVSVIKTLDLAQKQKYTEWLMEQERKFRQKPMHLWSINLGPRFTFNMKEKMSRIFSE